MHSVKIQQNVHFVKANFTLLIHIPYVRAAQIIAKIVLHQTFVRDVFQATNCKTIIAKTLWDNFVLRWTPHTHFAQLAYLDIL